MSFRTKTFLAALAVALASAVLGALAVRSLAPSDPLLEWSPVGVLVAGALLAAGAAACASAYLSREVRRQLRAVERQGRERLLAEANSATPGREPAEPFGETARLFDELAQGADRRVEMIEAESKQLKAVVGSMPEGILVTDADGQVLFANPQWRSLFGLAERTEDASVLDLSRQTALDRILATTLEVGQAQQVELELREPARRTLVLTSAPLLEAGGAVIVAQDMTEFLRLTEIRRDFVANVSHELKTPLSAIRGFAETLVDGAKDDPEASGEFLVRILKQCNRLEALLSDLLTLSRLEHAETSGKAVRIDFGEIVQEAIEVVSEGLPAKRLTLDFEQRPVPSIDGDAVALERLCVNLLENAVKYNRAGGRIWVRLYSVGSEVVLEVEDTGIGIPAGSLERLFERFYRVDKGRSREEGGTGLGLAIVKHSTNLHGGSIEVESELGKGSLFRVRLPKDRA